MNQVIQGECLEEMDKLIEQWIKVDAIITDPPYWTTACAVASYTKECEHYFVDTFWNVWSICCRCWKKQWLLDINQQQMETNNIWKP